MNFKIIETGKVCEIRLEDDNTGCDCFWDMEQNFPIDHPDRDDDDNIICTQEDYDDLKERAGYYKDTILLSMQEMRAVADEIEQLVGAEYWPYPTYGELLFHV